MNNQDKPVPVPANVWRFWTVIGVLIGVWILLKSVGEFQEKFQYIQTLLVSFSLVILVLYTVYTRKMQEAMVKQINIGILPIMSFSVPTNIPVGANVTLYVSNVGNGTALNLQIQPISIKMGPEQNHRYEPIAFYSIPSLCKNQTALVQHITRYDEYVKVLPGGPPPDLIKFLLPYYAHDDYCLKVQFSDMLGNLYLQTYEIGKSGVRIGGAIEQKVN